MTEAPKSHRPSAEARPGPTGDPFLEPKTPESEESLFWLAAPPLVWLLHLLASYLTAANFCAKAGSMFASLGPVRAAIGGYTAVALGALGYLTWRSVRRHRAGSATLPHDFDSRADRHRFLGFTMLLLSVVGILGVVFVALPALFM